MAPFSNHYATLGVNPSATADELRRAYRILARRYHPDVNPGRASEERFKAIAEAYAVLSDSEKRKKYDADFEKNRFENSDLRLKAYQRQKRDEFTARERFQRAVQETESRAKTKAETATQSKTTARAPRDPDWIDNISSLAKKIPNILKKKDKQASAVHSMTRVSVIEISISVKDAILGAKRAIEVAEPEGRRKVSVTLPPGTKNGSVLRLRNTSDTREELVLITRVASHPQLSIQNKGLVVEIPISLTEAINGASINVPTLDEPVMIKIAPNSQSGQEIRVKERGIAAKDGGRGDFFYRLMIQIPDSQNAVGLHEKASELEKYYSSSVRQGLPKTILEM